LYSTRTRYLSVAAWLLLLLLLEEEELVCILAATPGD
jgi:hypothetical protein